MRDIEPDSGDNQRATRDNESYIGGLKLQSEAKHESWFTFGQCHFHNIDGQIFDKDTVVKITANDPRTRMFELFGSKWAMQYDEEPNMSFYPRGVIEL